MFPRAKPSVPAIIGHMAEKQNMQDKRPAFGGRFLTDSSYVYEHNAWDHVMWDKDHLREAEQLVMANSSHALSAERSDKYEIDASTNWDNFYQQHQNRFFKDRHWLVTEFSELFTKEEPITVFEAGCGAGNTLFPLLQTGSPNLFVYCCDFSPEAVKLVKNHHLYDQKRCSVFLHDLSSEDTLDLPSNSIDFIILIFTLSAIPVKRMPSALKKLIKCLKPGGKLFFRDYGRLDLAQLRLKPGQCLSKDSYVRGDGTMVHFFTEDEVNQLLQSEGLVKEQLLTDSRLQVNRGKQLKMYRVWIQAKYSKVP